MVTIPNYTIAIDGYSSTGKSTLAKEVAQQLGFIHIDSGAMYRAVTLYGLRHFFDFQTQTINQELLERKLPSIKLEFKEVDGEMHIFMNGEDVEHDIRLIEVSNYVSEIAKNAAVRSYLVELQREMAKNQNVVMDGRDIGTVVFPNANIKFFITADAKERAKRRYKDLKEEDPDITLEEVEKNIQERDDKDVNREISPLKKADDAIVIDNTYSTKEETLQKMLQIIEENLDF